eukprot:SAG31_NODE_2342_length_5912_cov_1.363152_5_plen_109_part_00
MTAGGHENFRVVACDLTKGPPGQVGQPRLPSHSGTGDNGSGLTYIMGLEVLDNLPHDKVVWSRGDGCQQAVVRSPWIGWPGTFGLPQAREDFEPLDDPLIVAALQVCA